MFRIYFLLLIPLASIFFITSCTQKKSAPQLTANEYDLVVVENVPFVKQKDKFCGPAAMASVMQFYGQNIDQDEIGQEVYIPELNGALISDMENYARENGYSTETTNGDIESLKLHIDDQQPVILLVEKGKWRVSVPHYYVAYGYNDEKRVILLHTGFESEQEISFDKLDNEWKKMNRLMLVIKK